MSASYSLNRDWNGEHMSKGVHYDLDPATAPEPYSSHAYLLQAVPLNSRCLEIGCATGYMSQWLESLRGAEVVAVEVAPEAARRASERGITVICGSIEDEAVQRELSSLGPFDCVVLANVLEHIVDPARVIGAIKKVVSGGCAWVIAVPNIAHLSSRLRLLAGRWRYDEYGLFDSSHVRFWNLPGFLSLLASSELKVDSVRWTVGYSPWPVRLLLRVLPLGGGRYPKVDRLLGNALGYELVVVASSGDSS